MHRRNLLLLICFFSFSLTQAQNKPAAKGFKPPELVSSIGGHSGKATVTVNEAKRIIELPLLIREKISGKPCTVSSYRFLYREKTVAENESGKMVLGNAISSDLFKSTPLSSTWINNIREKFFPGEEISFLDIIVRDHQGRLMYAPDIIISIKE